MTKKLMLGVALSALMLSGAFAQMPNSPSSPNVSPAAKSDRAMPATSGQPDIVMSQKPDQWLASNFKGTDVLGSDGKKIGTVSDILFDKTGRIEAYVVSVGGFLGMGAKEVAIAPSSFTVERGQNGKPDKLTLAISQNDLKQAQNFQPYQPPRPTTTGSAPGGPLGGGMQPPSSRP